MYRIEERRPSTYLDDFSQIIRLILLLGLSLIGQIYGYNRTCKIGCDLGRQKEELGQTTEDTDTIYLVLIRVNGGFDCGTAAFFTNTIDCYLISSSHSFRALSTEKLGSATPRRTRVRIYLPVATGVHQRDAKSPRDVGSPRAGLSHMRSQRPEPRLSMSSSTGRAPRPVCFTSVRSMCGCIHWFVNEGTHVRGAAKVRKSCL